MIEAFPEEIRHDILLRLPIKCLIRCTSVSKPWLSIVKDTGFIRAHLRRRHEPLILVHGARYKTSKCEEVEGVYSLYRDNPTFDEYCEIDFQIDLRVDPTNVRVAGICDGLVCLADDIIMKNLRYLIWNPSIRKTVMLPRPGFTYTTHGAFQDSVGFGFDATANDYKVVRLVILETLEDKDVKSPTVAEVYSIATGSWRSLGSVSPPCDIFGIRPQAFFNGTIHWIVNHWKVADGVLYFILAFNIVSESFRQILLPTGVKLSFNGSQVSVTGDGKHLALFTTYNDGHHNNYLDIWVMKEYCQPESWTKMITLAPQGPGGSAPAPHMAFCFRQNGEVILDLRETYFCQTQTLVSLDPVSQRMNNVGIPDRACSSFGSYEESLVLLNMDSAISC